MFQYSKVLRALQASFPPAIFLSLLLQIEVNSFAQQNQIGSTGNVGVGTQSPVTLLDVNGLSTFRNVLTVDFGETNRKTRLRDNGLFFSRIPDGLFVSSITADGHMYFDTRNDYYFRNDEINTLAINGNGNVGIGTINPNYKLEVAGNTHVTGVLTLGTGIYTGGYIGAGNTFLNYGSSAMKVADGSVINWSATSSVDGASDLGLARNAAGVLKITNGSSGHGSVYAGGTGNNYFGGRVGVGTSTPNYNLEVNGTAHVAGVFTIGTGAFTSGYIGAGNTFLNYGLSAIKVANNSAINWSGTSSPDGTSDVGIERNAAGVLKVTNGSTGGGSIYAAGSASNYFAGNVGIGVTTPTSKLTVDGQVLATKVKVQQTVWPDYVFANGYPLPSLKDVGDFIRANGHLPEVPSAAEVEKKGLDLGDNQATLLRKIEELTLYILELNTKMESQQRQIEILKNKVGKIQ